jgi:hypothetical protein
VEVFEYYGQMSENGQLAMPDEIKKQLDPKTRLRVMIFLEKDEPDWGKMTAVKFFQGYAEEDKIYDDL